MGSGPVVPPPPTGFTRIPDPPPGFSLVGPGQQLPAETPESKARREKENKEPIDYAGIRKAALPMAGGIAGGLLAPFTGGMSAVPAALMAAGSAGIGGALGSSVEQGIEKFRGEPDAPKTFGEGAKRAGIEGAEQGGAELGGRALTGALSKALGKFLNPEALYQSALKPVGARESKVASAVSTGVKEGIPLEDASRGMVGGQIDKLHKQAEDAISSAPADISPQRFVRNIEGKFDALRKQWSKDATNGQKFVSRIDEMERQFLVQHGNPAPIVKTVQVPVQGNLSINPVMQSKTITIMPEDMTLAELRQQARPLSTTNAQAIKKQTYETIRTSNKTAWDVGQHPGLDVRASKEITRALREELENIYPQIKGINQRLGAFIGLEEQLDRFVKREMNRQITSMTLFGAAGYAAGQHMGGQGEVGLTAGLLLRKALESPAIKSRLAILIDQAPKIPGAKAAAFAAKQVPQTAIRAGVAGLTPPPQKNQ